MNIHLRKFSYLVNNPRNPRNLRDTPQREDDKKSSV